jgi:hypothetical protein
VAFFYATSPDNVIFGSYADAGALLASTFSGGNAQGFHTLALPNALTNFIRFSLSGTGSNPQDSLATVDLVLRMST